MNLIRRLSFILPFLGVSIFVFGESEKWLDEHTLGTIAIRATCGEKKYFNTSGDKGYGVRMFWDHCNYKSEQFQLILLENGPIFKNMQKEISSLREENLVLKNRLREDTRESSSPSGD